MKELSIEEKAKAYDEAIDKIKYVMEHGVSPTLNKEDLQDIFPELKESEDERIRKAIHIYLDWLDGRNKDYHPKGDYSIKDMITWLEKQGEQKLPIEKLPEEMKTIVESLGFTSQEICDKYNQMVSDLIMSDDDKGEQKPTDKAKPKFRVKYAGSEYNVFETKD